MISVVVPRVQTDYWAQAMIFMSFKTWFSTVLVHVFRHTASMGDTSHLSLFWCIFHCFFCKLLDSVLVHGRISLKNCQHAGMGLFHTTLATTLTSGCRAQYCTSLLGLMLVQCQWGLHHLVWFARPWSPQVQLMCQVCTKHTPWLGLPCVKTKNIKEIWVLSHRFGCYIVLHTKVISEHGYGNMLVATLKWPGQNVHCACGRGEGFGRLGVWSFRERLWMITPQITTIPRAFMTKTSFWDGLHIILNYQ
jgi:hypothetical protein